METWGSSSMNQNIDVTSNKSSSMNVDSRPLVAILLSTILKSYATLTGIKITTRAVFYITNASNALAVTRIKLWIVAILFPLKYDGNCIYYTTKR